MLQNISWDVGKEQCGSGFVMAILLHQQADQIPAVLFDDAFTYLFRRDAVEHTPRCADGNSAAVGEDIGLVGKNLPFEGGRCREKNDAKQEDATRQIPGAEFVEHREWFHRVQQMHTVGINQHQDEHRDILMHSLAG